MSTKYKATDKEHAYFITVTTVGWVDVFTRLNQKYIIIDALRYCQKNKGLEIYGYCLIHSHACPERSRRMYLLCKAVGEPSLSEIMRNFKKFTSKKIIKTIQEERES